ncbi:hypothetical protein [Burkholderia cepacia]|uniref:hypothetical protein n=1 Tax=Burkholderia cepacia TaxID=292 RepID=UPI001C967947|nr:hypothetical protein [Burkholderia cepacia]MBY4803058.1 hypothetical protein [Burkholderia cepacia]MCA8333736.1 hypothetical protein [Burkholderia cepacia]
MAASEIAMAASAVTTTATQLPAVNGWTLVLSSAVVSAVVNGAFNWWNARTALRHEKSKLAEQRAPAQLDAALMLEAFAKQALGYFDHVQAKLFDWHVRHDPDRHGESLEQLDKWVSLTFDESLAKDWATLPIGILSACRELPLSLAESDRWTRAMAKEDHVDFDDACELDGQRAILYGLLAGELANQIRSGINVPASPLATASFNRLQGEFEKLKNIYVSSAGKIELIPDLRTRLQRERPDVPNPFPPAPSKAPALDGVA